MSTLKIEASYYQILKKVFAIAVFICLVLGSCSFKNPDRAISARLIRVISGQTIEVILPQNDSQPQRVRIIGINVPKDEQWENRAKIRIEKLIADNKVDLELERDELDRYNRLLAHVWHHDVLVSEKLAKEGYVVANNKYLHRYSNRLFHAQEYARILGYGIWQ